MWQIVAWVAMMVLSYLLKPKVSTSGYVAAPVTSAGAGSTPPTPGEVSGTTVDGAGPVPVLFGTRLLSETNCVWYGDVATKPITKCNEYQQLVSY